MINLLLFLLVIFAIYIIYLHAKLEKVKNQNLITFRNKLKVNSICMLQEWNDDLDKFKLIKVTIIKKGVYSITVIDEEMKYHTVNEEDLFPFNYFNINN